MRRYATLGLLFLFIGATLTLAGESYQKMQTKNNIVLPATGTKKPVKPRRLDDSVYSENWENGLNGWVSKDMTDVPGTWHIDDWFAFGDVGQSWCMGQNPVYCDTVGYLDDWYMTLDSPLITLPAGGCTLSFWSRIGCEPPEGTDPPYDGWDGCNLRILAEAETIWTVITDDYLEPDYDRTSLYSFGFQHEEGPDVPGWVGQHFDWFLQTADLSAWAGQTVQLRWAFASDPAWCTCYTSATRWAFGWQIDNIRVFAGSDTVFSNDADDDTDWTSGTNRPIGGDFWRVADDCNPPPCPPPSGSHYLVCNDTTDLSYTNNMNDEIVSPYIDLRDLDFGTLQGNFWVAGELATCNEFPDCDYWHWEVSPDSGRTWYYASAPCGAGDNFVHPDAPADWCLYTECYTSGFDLTCYLGSVVQLKAVMESNDDDLLGFGPCFDGITIIYTSGFPNDMSCYSLQIPFPTNEGLPVYAIAYFENMGSLPQAGVPASWEEVGGSMHRLMPNLALVPGERVTRTFTWTPSAMGVTALLAYTWLNVDEDLGNDTSYCRDIDVRSADWYIDGMELGYDNRSTQYRFNYETGNGALVKFTPVADSVEMPFNINTIRMQFDAGQIGTQEIGLRIFEDDGGVPGEAIFWGTSSVASPTEVAPNWKEVIVDGVPSVWSLTGDFWIWLEVLSTDPDQRYPQILGDDAEAWENHEHFYTYSLGSTPEARPYFYMVRALVDRRSDAEGQELAPLTYSLNQNYPNPFNPTTEISYSLTRTEKVSLRVFNLLGQEIEVLTNGVKSAGVHRVFFDGSDYASGVYVYRLETPNFTATHKMVLMK